ncbi:MAG: hypothetical protein KDH94_08140 [Coxiellaceae bacterium]|nr:hypothetical protein [Coxiellaceae bacterium]
MIFHCVEGVEKILFDKEFNFSSSVGYKTGSMIFPRGLLMRDAEDHVFHLRIMQAAF